MGKSASLESDSDSMVCEQIIVGERRRTEDRAMSMKKTCAGYMICHIYGDISEILERLKM